MTEEQIKEKLRAVKYPGFTRDIVSFGIVKEVAVDAKRTQIRLSVVTENADVVRQIVRDVERCVTDVEGIGPPDVIVERPRPAAAPPVGSEPTTARRPSPLPDIARVIAVASGKGGVGKSTVAANLAVALGRLNQATGLLDADVYGPSLPLLFGLGQEDVATVAQQRQLRPLERHGVKLLSMGFFVAPGAPLIWRGPMLTKALGQFLRETEWGGLDYLIVDLPPGTGDVQLTLTTQVALDGGVLVTTPQDVALADVERGLKMFQQVNVPVLGIIENMSYHICPGCGETAAIFGRGGGQRMADKNGVALLGEIPLVTAVREAGDRGCPLVAEQPESVAAGAFIELARRVQLELPPVEAGHA